jgi:hypothetical protein
MSEAVTQEKPNRIPTPEELGFDPAALRAKYAAGTTGQGGQDSCVQDRLRPAISKGVC